MGLLALEKNWLKGAWVRSNWFFRGSCNVRGLGGMAERDQKSVILDWFASGAVSKGLRSWSAGDAFKSRASGCW